jgi:hypothetical protein
VTPITGYAGDPLPHMLETPDGAVRLPYACLMVVLANGERPGRDGRRRVPRLATVAIFVVLAVLLGYLGWVLPSAGGSLAFPTLIVFGIGCAVGFVYLIITGSRATAVAFAAITVAASVWTFAYSLPASVAWDSTATSQAQAALLRLTSSPRSQYGIPLHPCSTKYAGSVGPINAPYRECAVSTPEGHFVIFTFAGQNGRGLAYTDRGAATFLDECSRHLTGKWWMFTKSTSGTGDCPIGYQFHGGP